MIRPQFFIETLAGYGITSFFGVPDSLLKNICAYITDHSSNQDNIIAANEGAAMGLAVGTYLSTGKIPMVYMQNSGIGNAVNPLMSLTDKEVYNIPVLLLIGWRGEPGVHDEPQHVKQGKATLPLLDAMGIKYAILSDEETLCASQINEAVQYMNTTKEPYALVVRKGTFAEYRLQNDDKVDCEMSREEAIEAVVDSLPENAVVVSTTGMISRELFEIRERRGQGHAHDFLTVGSMGHASQIAFGIALQQPERPVFCFDGDGAMLMHMGSMAIIGNQKPKNFVHIVFNNGAHDSVGGQPTVAFAIDSPAIARACGYDSADSVVAKADLNDVLSGLKQKVGSCFIEVKVLRGARKNLGRPTTTPIENKQALMEFLHD